MGTYIGGKKISPSTMDLENVSARVDKIENDVNTLPAYTLSTENSVGNVLEVGTIVIDGSIYSIYEFYYKTGRLPDTSAITYSFADTLAEYNIKCFIGAQGVTTDGIVLSNGRTDNTNAVIIQQFSKNSKTVMIRSYRDFSGQDSILKIIFIGNKI